MSSTSAVNIINILLEHELCLLLDSFVLMTILVFIIIILLTAHLTVIIKFFIWETLLHYFSVMYNFLNNQSIFT